MDRSYETHQNISASDSASDSSNHANPVHQLGYVKILPYDHDGSLLYTTIVGPFQVISMSDIKEIVGLIKNTQRLYIVSSYASSWDHLRHLRTPT